MFSKIITDTERSEQTSAFHISFLLTSVILIYYIMTKFGTRFFNSEQTALFNEYYHDNKLASLFVDHLFVLAYLSIAMLILHYIIRSPLKDRLNLSTVTLAVIVIIFTTVVLDYCIALRVRNYNGSNKIVNFFKRWAKAAGYKAVVWDIVYLLTIFFVALILMKYNVQNNTIAVALFFTLFLMHLFV
jgi:hypothetical protein